MFTPQRLSRSDVKHAGTKWLVGALIGLITALTLLPADAANIQFDEPLEGRTRACVGSVCVDSLTASVSRSTSGSISSLDLFGGLPPAVLPFANLLDLQSYQTSQALSLDLVDGLGTVVNTLDVAFRVANLQYTADFLFRSDASGLLPNGLGIDVLATGGYQDLTSFLQSQVDLSGLAYPFGALAEFFQPSFFPVSVAIRTGALDVIEPPVAVPEPTTLLLLLAGFLSWRFAVPVRAAFQRHRRPLCNLEFHRPLTPIK